jgi:hypothetical protein
MKPNPPRDVLARWIFQAGDFVQIEVIEAIENRLKGSFNVSEIHYPAEMLIDWSIDEQFHAKGMAV